METVEALRNAVRGEVEAWPVNKTDWGDPIGRELVHLWNDLADAIRYAHNGRWSIRCEYVVHRIVALTVLAGKAPPWRDMPSVLLKSGVYQALHDEVGIEVQPACGECNQDRGVAELETRDIDQLERDQIAGDERRAGR